MKYKLYTLALVSVFGLTGTSAQEALDLSTVLTTSQSVTITSQENDAAYPWSITEDGYLVNSNNTAGSRSDFTITVNGDEWMRLTVDYERNTYYYDSTCVIVNGVKKYARGNVWDNTSGSLSIPVSPGESKITFRYYLSGIDSNYSQTFKLKNINISAYVDEQKVIAVSDPGTLGRLALEQVTQLTDMTSMKLSGTLNSDDWNDIRKMTNLQYLDIEETTVTEIPDQAFVSKNVNNANMVLPIVRIVWPANLQRIGASAFYSGNIACQLTGDLTFPSTLTSIGNSAFRNSDNITSVTLPAALQEMGTYVFYDCNGLRTATFQNSMETIPERTFEYCSSLTSVTIPNSVTSIGNAALANCSQLHTVNGLSSLKTVGEYAFYRSGALKNLPGLAPEVIKYSAFGDCSSLQSFDFTNTTHVYGWAFCGCHGLTEVNLPKIQNVEDYAFYSCNNLQKAILGDDITTIPHNVFYSCGKLEEITLGASVASIGNDAFRYSSSLKKLYINAPVPPSVNTNSAPVDDRSKLTLYVPKYAMVEYKLHDYWSQCGAFAENNNAVENVVLNHPLTLSTTTRIPNTPNVTVNRGAALTVNGSLQQPMKKFTANFSFGTNASIISRCANMTSTASEARYYMDYSGTPYWYFVCPPFDVNVADITTTNGAHLVIRYYDSELRATGSGSNWKNVDADAVLRAGQAYIFCVSANCDVVLPATEETHNDIFSPDSKTVTLSDYASADETDANWNLVGNPYPAYYDISKMDFTAPITVWSTSRRTYTAYSVADDQLALLPLQGFFVQKPEGTSSIVFREDGRKVDATFEAAARTQTRAGAGNRHFVEFTLSCGEAQDMTRIVVNPQASDEYDVNTDAAKMMAYETTPQLYSMSQGNAYAINEGKQEGGLVQLGMWLPKEGTYVIDLKRADLDVQLLDNGQPVAMPYSFTAGEGYAEGRFAARINMDIVTGIDGLGQDTPSAAPTVYDLQGRKLQGKPQRGVYIENGKKVIFN